MTVNKGRRIIWTVQAENGLMDSTTATRYQANVCYHRHAEYRAACVCRESL